MTTLSQAIKSGEYKVPAKVSGKWIKTAVGSRDKAREQLHFMASNSLFHIIEHDNADVWIRLLKAMGTRSQTRQRLVAWANHHCHKVVEGKVVRGVVFAFDKHKQPTVKFGKKAVREEVCNIEKAFSEPYWDTVKATAVKADFELAKGMLSLIKRDIKADNEATLENFIAEATKQWNKAMVA